MATNRQHSPVELLLERLNIALRSINLNFLKSHNLLYNRMRLICKTEIEFSKHLECHFTLNTADPKFTIMPLDKLTETLIHSNFYNIVKNEVKLKTTPKIIGACDGGVKSFRSIIYSIASFSFSPSSHIFGSTGVTQSIDSTHSELIAIFDLLSQSVINN